MPLSAYWISGADKTSATTFTVQFPTEWRYYFDYPGWVKEGKHGNPIQHYPPHQCDVDAEHRHRCQRGDQDLHGHPSGQCATADTGTLLVTFAGNATAFGSAATGVLTANAIANATAAGTGTAGYPYRTRPQPPPRTPWFKAPVVRRVQT
jgi:hypothetical protein